MEFSYRILKYFLPVYIYYILYKVRDHKIQVVSIKFLIDSISCIL